jgi:hypothetical protein
MGPRSTDGIEVFHGRIRLAVNARLDDTAKSTLHRLLANALESSQLADPEQLAHHWQGAGDSGRAARYAIIGADRAAAALAFDRAASLYHLALSLRGEGDDVIELYAKQADALAKAGRGTEAAEQYLAAASRSHGPDAIEYKRLAAEELLRAGHVRRGLAILETVLGSVGLSLPRSPRTALLSAVARRAQLRLRGTRFSASDSIDIDDDDIVRLDVCRSAAIGLAMVDIVRGADFQTRSLILALRSGERRRIAHALALEAAYLYTAGATGGSRADTLLEEARQTAHSVGDPFATAIVIGAGGIGAFQQGQWARCRQQCEKATAMLRDRCVGAWWELATVNQFNFSAMFYAGDIAELSERLPRHLRDAEMRGDLLAVTNLSTAVPQLAWLARDDVDGARRLASDAMSRWRNESFDLQHYYELLSQGHVDIYAGEGNLALERIERGWEPLKKSMLMRSQFIRISMIELRARAELAVAAASGEHTALKGVLTAASRLDGEAIAWADPLADLLRAGAEHVAGRSAAALTAAERAVTSFETVGMPLHRAATQRLVGVLTGGARGLETTKTADQWLQGQGISDPTKMATMLAPSLAAG